MEGLSLASEDVDTWQKMNLKMSVRILGSTGRFWMRDHLKFM